MPGPFAWLRRLFKRSPPQPIGAFSALQSPSAKTRLDELRDSLPADLAPRTDTPDRGVGWAASLPARMLFLDVETTGLHSEDRIVSLAAIRLNRDAIKNGEVTIDYAYLVFDPERKSHRRAEEVHGWDDWTLRHQARFSESLENFESFLRGTDLIVAHNAEFDLRFVARELAIAGRPPLEAPFYCTLQGYRGANYGRASLDAICQRFGWPRSNTHGALEDAYLCMMLFLHLHKAPQLPAFPDFTQLTPANFVTPAPRPDGPLPRRKRRPRVLPNEDSRAQPRTAPNTP